jgi:hypothetical protein
MAQSWQSRQTRNAFSEGAGAKTDVPIIFLQAVLSPDIYRKRRRFVGREVETVPESLDAEHVLRK